MGTGLFFRGGGQRCNPLVFATKLIQGPAFGIPGFRPRPSRFLYRDHAVGIFDGDFVKANTCHGCSRRAYQRRERRVKFDDLPRSVGKFLRVFQFSPFDEDGCDF